MKKSESNPNDEFRKMHNGANDPVELEALLLRSPSFRAGIRAARQRYVAGKGVPLAQARRRLKA